MKKFVIAFAATLMFVGAFAAPAKADNSENVIIGVLGGALGGLIIGEALGSNRNPYYAQPPAFYAPPPQVYYAVPPPPVYPVYQEEYYPGAPVQCVYKKKKVYNSDINDYVIVKKKVCY